MGLAERRAIKEFQETTWAEVQKEIDGLLNFEVQWDIKWDSLAIEGSSHQYHQFKSIFGEPLMKALSSVCADDMGKEALQSTLKTIQIQNSSNIASENKWVKFEGGILTLDHGLGVVHNIDRRAKTLLEALEKAL